MRIALLQPDIAWLDVAQNLRHFEDMMRHSDPADLYVLPEMFATGFCIEPQGIAESCRDSSVVHWMQLMARRLDAAVAGTVAVYFGKPRVAPDGTAIPPSYRNRFYFVYPDGCYECYDKHHLFAYGGEDKHYTAGTERKVADFRGVSFLLQTCFDLRFPVWSRYKGDYDVILYAANWPRKRSLAWQTLIRARAIENQCYVVGVNRVGRDPNTLYAGQSALIHPYGHELVSCPEGKESVLVGTIDLQELRKYRKKFRIPIE